MSPRRVWAVAGPRDLSGAEADRFRAAVRALAARGGQVVVGCATGADALALQVCRPVRVLAAWGPDATGACRWSAVGPVQLAAAAGVPVTWWAGGGPAQPLPARLRGRTHAVVSAADAGLLVALRPGSRGSLLAARHAVRRGLQVVACPLGDSLPLLGPGAWEWVAGAPWGQAWRWQPGQKALF